MINPQELRIGNWVNSGHWGEGHIAEITSEKVYVIHPSNPDWRSAWVKNELDPIPLTPEIFKAVGLHKRNSAWVPEGHENTGYLTWNFTIWDNGDKTYYYNSAEFPTPLTSLHQLQNLYFALTNKELTYKP